MPVEALKRINPEKIEKKRSMALLDFSNDLVMLNKQILEKHFSSQRTKQVVPPQSCPNRATTGENRNPNGVGNQINRRRFKNSYVLKKTHDDSYKMFKSLEMEDMTLNSGGRSSR